MKYLADYMQEAQSELFKKTGAFFAFSKTQFNEKKVENITYVALDGGLVCPKNNVEQLIQELDSIYKNGIELDLKENGKQMIIKRELYNHECFYTGDITSCVEKLEDYPITEKEILQEFKKIAFKES